MYQIYERSSWEVGGLSGLTSRVSNNTRSNTQLAEHDLEK